MDLLTAEIRIGGDMRNTVVKGAHNPITPAEVEILKVVHGEDAIVIGDVCGTVDRTAKAEKARLADRYDSKLVDAVFPGVAGNGIEVGETPAPKKKRVRKPAAKKTSLEPKTEDEPSIV